LSSFLGKWGNFGNVAKRESGGGVVIKEDPLLGIILTDFGSNSQLYYLRTNNCELDFS